MGPSQGQGRMTHPPDWPSAECAALQQLTDAWSAGEILLSPGQVESMSRMCYWKQPNVITQSQRDRQHMWVAHVLQRAENYLISNNVLGVGKMFVICA